MTNWDNGFDNLFGRAWDKRKIVGHPRGFKPWELPIPPSDRHIFIKLKAVAYCQILAAISKAADH